MTPEHVLLLAVGGPVAMGVAVLSARINPLKVCPKCKGTGRRGTASARRVCRTCGGEKEIRRWLAPRS